MADNTFEHTPMAAVAFHSGFGHTATLAGAVADGARSAGATAISSTSTP
jgi:NAD(P)H dehydrogenase (quinone)